MKYSDIVKLCESGLISAEQKDLIIERFHLKEEGGKLLAVLSFLGAILVTAGIILLLAANWEEIPRSVKIAGGLLLMLGAHGGGYYLREVHGKYRKTGEALHLMGAGLFLANIALIGQIYHLSSRPPNALLLWWAGIAPLPWLLRAKSLHVLTLLGIGIWFGMELVEPTSWIYFGGGAHQILLYALLGLCYLGLGYCLRRTSSWNDFAGATETIGLLGFHLFLHPLTWEVLSPSGNNLPVTRIYAFLGLSGLALALIGFGLKDETRLTRQWRWTWFWALVGAVGLIAGALFLKWDWAQDYFVTRSAGYNWIASIVLFVICLLQVHVGIQMRAAFLINVGIVFIALNIIATYICLIGSMASTGLIFVVSGIFLIAFGIYLEKKRRALVLGITRSTKED